MAGGRKKHLTLSCRTFATFNVFDALVQGVAAKIEHPVNIIMPGKLQGWWHRLRVVHELIGFFHDFMMAVGGIHAQLVQKCGKLL